MYKLVLLRHGRSEWNMKNRFTGWHDVGLAKEGITEAHAAGDALKKAAFDFDIAHTSLLKRAIQTLWITMEKLDLCWIPVIRDWRLNERHYGALTGLNKSETAQKHGEEQVLKWRRSFDIRPPMLTEDDPRFPGHDHRYDHIERSRLPFSECLEDTVSRVVEYWDETLSRQILAGKKLLIVAHGNSLRALIKYLDQISPADIINLNIPTGIPLVYELDSRLKPVRHYYLAEERTLQEALQAVKNQGKQSSD